MIKRNTSTSFSKSQCHRRIKIEENLQSIIKNQRCIIDDQIKVTANQSEYIEKLHTQILQLTQLILKERSIERAKNERQWNRVMKMIEDSRILDSIVNYFSRKN